MVPDHVIQYEVNPSSHHGGMREDRLTWTNGRTEPIPIFPDSTLVERGIIIVKKSNLYVERGK